jgi:methylmalonyl-CoA mutase, C-terminal domain
MSADTPVRVLVAKPGLDGHDRGAKVVAKAFRDAGMEVIYTGRHHSVDKILRTTLDEDVKVVGLSVLSGAHLDYCQRLADGLRAEGSDDIVLLIGGTIPAVDIPTLEQLGFRVFPTGSSLDDIVSYVWEAVGASDDAVGP